MRHALLAIRRATTIMGRSPRLLTRPTILACTMLVFAIPALAGCLGGAIVSYGHWYSRTYQVDDGYLVECEFHTDAVWKGALVDPEWKATMEDRAVSIVANSLRSKGGSVERSDVTDFSVAQHSIVSIWVVAGNSAFVNEVRKMADGFWGHADLMHRPILYTERGAISEH